VTKILYATFEHYTQEIGNDESPNVNTDVPFLVADQYKDRPDIPELYFESYGYQPEAKAKTKKSKTKKKKGAETFSSDDPMDDDIHSKFPPGFSQHENEQEIANIEKRQNFVRQSWSLRQHIKHYPMIKASSSRSQAGTDVSKKEAVASKPAPRPKKELATLPPTKANREGKSNGGKKEAVASKPVPRPKKELATLSPSNANREGKSNESPITIDTDADDVENGQKKLSVTVQSPGQLKTASNEDFDFLFQLESQDKSMSAYAPEDVLVDQSQSDIQQKNWLDAQNHPELGICYVTPAGQFVEIHTGQKVNEARGFLVGIGIPSRKGDSCKNCKICPKCKNSKKETDKGKAKPFMGKPVTEKGVMIYRSPPEFVTDCHQRVCHIYPPQLGLRIVQKLEHCIITFQDRPMFAFQCCSRHQDGCGKSLMKGDIVKIDGSYPSSFIKGRAWYHHAVRVDPLNLSSKCVVGIVKTFPIIRRHW
jgi:hypothetical protein